GVAWADRAQGGGQVEIAGDPAKIEMPELAEVGEDKCGPRIRAQRLAGGARRQVDVVQIQRGRPETANAIGADLAAVAAGDRNQSDKIVQDAGARLLMDAPDPVDAPPGAGHAALDLAQVPRLAPRPGQHVERQAEASGLADQALPKLAVDQDHPV